MTDEDHPALDGAGCAVQIVDMTIARTTIEAVLRRVPDWIRNELASKDSQERQRAEDALAAMIEAALIQIVP